MINFGAVETDLLVGNAPSTALDIERLKQSRVTAVLSLQSDADLRNHRIDLPALLRVCESHDIFHQRFAIMDFDEVDLGEKLAQPVIALHRLLGVGHRVYVHCNAGVCRAPATVLGYLCHYRGMTVDAGLDYIREARPQANPYIRAVEKALINLADHPSPT